MFRSASDNRRVRRERVVREMGRERKEGRVRNDICTVWILMKLVV